MNAGESRLVTRVHSSVEAINYLVSKHLSPVHNDSLACTFELKKTSVSIKENSTIHSGRQLLCNYKNTFSLDMTLTRAGSERLNTSHKEIRTNKYNAKKYLFH